MTPARLPATNLQRLHRAARRRHHVDSLIGPGTITTLPEATIASYQDHGTLARTIDADVERADATMRQLAALGIDMEDVGRTLEAQGVATFSRSFETVLASLESKTLPLTRR